MKLLKIEIQGVKNFNESKFEFDFTSHQRVSELDVDSNVFELFKNVQINSVFSIMGINASGKTTTLKLIDLISTLIGKSRDLTSLTDQQTLFLNSIFHEKVNIKTVWFHEDQNELLGDRIYLLESDLAKEEDEFNFFSNNQVLYRFTGENLKSISAKQIKSKKNLFKIITTNFDQYLDRVEVNKTLQKRVKDKADDYFSADMMDFGLPRTQSMSSSLRPFRDYSSTLYTESIDTSKVPRFVSTLPFEENVEIIKLFDPSVESIKKNRIETDDRVRNSYSLKFFNQDQISISDPREFAKYLSTGTLQGIEILCNARDVLKKGGIYLIDEIENHLSKSIIKLIIRLFTNSKTNPFSARLIFSTHYGELLDLIDRRDSIYIVNKKQNIISLQKASEIKELRNELKHSALFFGGHFGTGIEHQRLTGIQKLFIQNINQGKQ